MGCDLLRLWCSFVSIAFVPVHFLTCTVKLQFSGRYLTTDVQNSCFVIHCATLLYRKLVEPSKLTNVIDKNTNYRWCDEFKSVIHSHRPTDAALGAAVTIVSESQTQKSRIYMHCFPLPFRLIFFSSSWPAAPISCTERKKMRDVIDSDSPPTAVWRLRYRLASLVSELS